MIDFAYDTSKAQAAVAVAERRKLPVPQAIYDTAAMWDVVQAAAHMETPERPSRDDVPATADELRDLIEERAHAHRIAAAHRAVADDWREPISRRFVQLVRECADGWVSGLQPDFLALVKALGTQEKKLPDQLDPLQLDWRDAKIAAAWEKAESAAHQLDQLVADRQTIARAAGQDHGRDADLYAIAEIAAPSSDDVFDHKLRDHVGPAVREWKELRQHPVSRWLHLARTPHLTLSLATHGEVKDRQAVMDRWHDAVQVIMSSGLSRQQAEHAVTAALTARKAA